MRRFLADKNFNNDIIRGVRLRDAGVEIIRVQDTPMAEAADPAVIAWASDDNRIILTHDMRTFPAYAHARMRAGGHTAGVFMFDDWMPVGRVTDELLIAHGASEMADWVDVVAFFPL